MSALTHEHLAIQVRQKLRLPPTATLDLQPLVPVALNQLAVQVAGDYKKRHWLLTDPSAITATLTSGVADLSALIASDNILIEMIRYGMVYYNAITGQPLIWQNQVGIGRMAGPYDQLFNHVWAQGTTLQVRGPNATALSGTLYLAIPFVASLDDLPEPLTDDLVNTLARLVVMPAANENAA